MDAGFYKIVQERPQHFIQGVQNFRSHAAAIALKAKEAVEGRGSLFFAKAQDPLFCELVEVGKQRRDQLELQMKKIREYVLREDLCGFLRRDNSQLFFCALACVHSQVKDILDTAIIPENLAIFLKNIEARALPTIFDLAAQEPEVFLLGIDRFRHFAEGIAVEISFAEKGETILLFDKETGHTVHFLKAQEAKQEKDHLINEINLLRRDFFECSFLLKSRQQLINKFFNLLCDSLEQTTSVMTPKIEVVLNKMEQIAREAYPPEKLQEFDKYSLKALDTKWKQNMHK